MEVNVEALQLHAVYKSRTFYCKSHENQYQYYNSRKNLYDLHAVYWNMQ